MNSQVALQENAVSSIIYIIIRLDSIRVTIPVLRYLCIKITLLKLATAY